MKNLILAALAALVLQSCADKITQKIKFRLPDGTEGVSKVLTRDGYRVGGIGYLVQGRNRVFIVGDTVDFGRDIANDFNNRQITLPRCAWVPFEVVEVKNY